MRKNAVSKSKKNVPVNNGQKISSFFTKLSATTSSSVTSSSNVFWDDTSDDFKEPTTAQTIAKSSITLKETVKKSSPKKQSKFTRASKKKSPLKAAKPVASTAKSIFHKKLHEDKVVASDSDSDFALDKKVKVVNNLLAAFKSKHKFIYDKTSKESTQNAVNTVKKVTERITKGKNKIVRKVNSESESAKKSDGNVITVDLDSNNELELPKNNVTSTNLNKQAISPGGDVNSQLIIDPNDNEDVPLKISPTNARIFDDTSEITYLQRDEILVDITASTNLPNSRDSLDVLYTNISFKKSDRSQSPPHSTPSEICKKRKLELVNDSPDVIPSTPEEQVTNKSVNRKGKSKICIENKFSKYAHPLLVGKYNTDDYVVPDMVVKSPPVKKIRATELGKVMNLTDIKAHEFDQILELSLAKSSATAKVAENVKLVSEKCDSVAKKCDISAQKCHNAIKKQQNTLPIVLDSDSDDFVIRKPPITPPKSPTNPNNLVKSTSKFIVSPAKNISPSRNSPHKGIVLKMPFSPTKSVSKLKRSLFNCVSQNDVQETNSENNTVFASTNGDIKVTSRQDSPLKNKLGNGLLNYFTNVSSSKDESNTILPRKSLSPKKTDADENVDDFDDLNFDDGWDEELNNIEEKLEELNLETWQYCKVLEVTKDLHQNIILKLRANENTQETRCMLQGMWTNSRLQTGDTINILATKSTGQIPFTVNNNTGYVIYEPDMLISPTSIVGAQFCKRRGILADKFRGTDPGNKVMLVGTLVHSLLQEVLKQKIYSASLIEKKLVEMLDSKEIIYKSFAIQIPMEEIKNDLLPFVPKIVTFINKYVKNDNRTKVKNPTDDWTGSIQSIQDIEENIWSSRFGIKGKVDVTIRARPLGALLPLELKTGRATMSLEHKGQLIIYVMLMTELGYEVNSGLLLYLREDKIKEVKTTHGEKRDLIMLRNDVAYYLKQVPKVPMKTQESVNSDSSKSLSTILFADDPMKSLIMSELPEPISHRNACQKCPYATICTTYLSRDTTCSVSDQHPLKELSTELLAHLEPAHIDYFMHWTSLITVENNYQPPIKELKHIWRLKPYEREQRGKSLAYLKLIQSVKEENDTYKHTFARGTDDNVKILTENNLKLDLLKSGLVASNYVVISTDVRPAIATGFVTQISQEQIEVNLERNLTERYLNKTFHIDSYESQTLSNFCMTSTAELLVQSERAKRLRELIIDKKPSVIMGKLSKNIMSIGGHILKRLNKIQQRAVLLALTIKDYLLIKGMPGTGKTATVVALIQLLVQLKKTVLITSHTHSAVDNVCLRLLDCGVDVLRLGSEHRVHPRLKCRTEGALTSDCKTVDDLKQVYNSAQVVAVTCLAAAHPIFTYRTLDVCIVDESTQVLQCSLIKTLLSTSSFILIGDPDQLPPVVKNPEAMRRGMSESLFERLDNPLSTVTLTLQYRMNKVITELANAVTYHGHLLCADDNIGFAVLDLPEIERLQSFYNKEQWILNALDTKIENSVIALNTGPTWNIHTHGSVSKSDNLLAEIQVPAQNVSEDEERKCSNLYEAGLVMSLIEALKQAGVPSEEIGIIAPYRAQVGLLRRLVANITDFDCSAVEVNTVDQYQGRDKDVIIYSCTKSKKASKTKTVTGYEILEDKRRLTVAITRAKHKLIIIGDFLTLKSYTPFEKLLNNINVQQYVQLEENKDGFNWERIMKRVIN